MRYWRLLVRYPFSPSNWDYRKREHFVEHFFRLAGTSGRVQELGLKAAIELPIKKEELVETLFTQSRRPLQISYIWMNNHDG
jgi:hypothetical protein